MAPRVSSARRASAAPRLAVAGVLAAVAWKGLSCFSFAVGSTRRSPASTGAVTRPAATLAIENPTKTVADSMADFYKAYPQPPVLPLFRTSLMDILSQLHLLVHDARFKYDAVWAFGLRESFQALMQSYDGLTHEGQSQKIWKALVNAVGLDPEQVEQDAQAVEEYAKATPPAQILQQLEDKEAGGDGKVSDALRGIRDGLYSRSFSMGIIKMMELSGAEVKEQNLEEWMKAMGLPASKANKDLGNYRAMQHKMSAQMDLIREQQIREKKQLAERLEQKAKALAAKASAKAAEAGATASKAAEA